MSDSQKKVGKKKDKKSYVCLSNFYGFWFKFGIIFCVTLFVFSIVAGVRFCQN
ncbi:hypothetical protein HanPSC8_Chr08g0319311 [Helianthus annuus]|nr:hypothetical protein HanPSC8_Chr08g0319311 [Helianthus annuus]